MLEIFCKFTFFQFNNKSKICMGQIIRVRNGITIYQFNLFDTLTNVWIFKYMHTHTHTHTHF